MAKNYRFSFGVLTLLFFIFGLITVLVDSLIPRLRELFGLSFFQAGLVQFAFFIAYGLVSIPAGKLIHKIGYKNGIVVGMVTMAIGCFLFYPAAGLRTYLLFILGYFVLASGMTILQVAANPYVTVLGKPETAASRLTFAQAFNSLGTAIAPALGAILILSDQILTTDQINALEATEKASYLAQEASAVQQPFIILASIILIIGFGILFIKLPQLINTNQESSYFKALKQPKLLMGTFGIFAYVGSEVAIGSFLVNYFISLDLVELIKSSELLSNFVYSVHSSQIDEIDQKGIVATFVVLYWSGAMVGRFIGSYLNKLILPNRLLMIFASGAISMIFISMVSGGLVAMFSILAVGLFNSIMFPTIFSIAIEDLGDLKPEGSGLLCTAIAGGAFIPPLYGLFTDLSGFKWAFLLIVACYGYILYYGKKSQTL